MNENLIPRLSNLEYRILKLLVQSQKPWYGMQIHRATRIRTKSVYATLKRMEHRGFLSSKVTCTEAFIHASLRYYSTTAYGLHIFNAWASVRVPQCV